MPWVKDIEWKERLVSLIEQTVRLKEVSIKDSKFQLLKNYSRSRHHIIINKALSFRTSIAMRNNQKLKRQRDEIN